MFGLFKQKISKREYGQLILRNAIQYIDKTSLGVDLILKAHSDIVKGTIDVENDFEKIYLIQFSACVAVGELTLYSMDRHGISVYEIRNGFIEHIENMKKAFLKEKSIQLSVDFLKVSQDLTALISNNEYLAQTESFYSDNGFTSKDIYGEIAVYIFQLATKEHPHLQNLIFENESNHGALKLITGIDTSFRFIRHMYKSYKIV